MERYATRPNVEFEPSRPWVIGAVLLCAIGTLGSVAVAASPGDETGTRSEIGDLGRGPGFADVFRVTPGLMPVEATFVVAALTIAGIVALWWSVRRAWPWLLVAGVVLTIPGEFIIFLLPQGRVENPAWLVYGLVTAGAQLTLLGTLGLGLRLIHIKAVGAGAVLVGAGLGAQVFGAAIDVPIIELLLLRRGVSPSALQSLLHDGLLVAAAGGALLAMMLYRGSDGRPDLAGPGDEPTMGRRAAVAGAAAATVFVLATDKNGEFDVVAGALLLAVGLAAAAIAGVRPIAGTVIASAVVVGISGPTGALIQGNSAEPIGMWFWTALGVVIGAAAAFPSWRRWAAAGVCASCVVLLAATMAISPDGMPVPFLALLLAAATTAFAALGVYLAEDGSLPIVLGPTVFATATGAYVLLAHWQDSGRDGPGEELFREPEHLWLHTVLLLTAAAALAVPKRLSPQPKPN